MDNFKLPDQSPLEKIYGTPVLKLWLKREPWHITETLEERFLVIFMQEEDSGTIRTFLIPKKDLLNWSLEHDYLKDGPDSPVFMKGGENE
jgi:hypothetical protein